MEALEAALEWGSPEIFNTDQGVQFTTSASPPGWNWPAFRSAWTAAALGDNVFVERLWWRVKYECLYLHDFATVRALEAGLAKFFQFYNDERLSCGLGLPHAGDDVRGGMRHPTKSLPWSKSRRFFSEKIGRIFVYA